MKIQFFGATRTVTGSCYLLEHEGTRFLVDCGMYQGNKALKERNYGDFPFNPGDIDFLLLTHAHIDHSGLLPKLYKCGFKNPIYATSATVALCEIMLPDSGYIQEMEVERKNRKALRAGAPTLEPIYTAEDAMATQSLFSAVEYDTSFSPVPGIEIVLHDAGHILGSAMAEIHYKENGTERKLVFTGDLGRKDQAIVRDPYIMHSADYLVMESTYGNRLHEGGMEEEMPRFTKIANETFARGGNVIIPAFAVDRTQDILMMIHELQQSKQLVDCKVYVDSPLAVKATEIFASHPQYFDRLTTRLFKEEGHAPFVLDNLVYVRSAEESQQLNMVKSGALIISASGMADAGRIKHHLKHNLWRKECSILFFGFQAEGTLGRRLIEGEKKVTIHGEEIDVKAQIYNMEGFSAHADKNDLIDWLSNFETLPRKIFITHGEEGASLEFAETAKKELHANVCVPEVADLFDLTQEEPAAIPCAKTFAETVAEENLLVDINTALQNITMSSDLEKLIRVRDFLRKIS